MLRCVSIWPASRASRLSCPLSRLPSRALSILRMSLETRRLRCQRHFPCHAHTPPYPRMIHSLTAARRRPPAARGGVRAGHPRERVAPEGARRAPTPPRAQARASLTTGEGAGRGELYEVKLLTIRNFAGVVTM